MDFTFDEDLRALAGLADDIVTGHATTGRVAEVEAGGTRVDDALWRALAGANLLGIALPERHGGSGLGMSGLCVVLEALGRRVAPVPVWPSVVASLALADATDGADAADGTGGGGWPDAAARCRGWLPSLAEGTARLTLALEEFAPADPAGPDCAARGDGAGGWTLTGTKAAVPVPDGADAVLVSATTDHGPGLFLLDSAAPGVTWEHAETTSRQWCGHLTLDSAQAAEVAMGTAGRAALARTLRRAHVALAAVQLGVTRGALAHATGYLSERRQFGRPLGTFQAVAHQLADCHIDIEAAGVTLWQAAARLDEADGADADPADLDRTALVAKWWATDAGQRVVHRVQHVHGGIGVDLDYPVHRHYLWGKEIAGTLGGPSADLDRLGAVLATTEVTAS